MAPEGGSPAPPAPLRDAARFWEPRRLWYNLALGAQVGAWLILTWPHFRPAFTLSSLAKLFVLAILANACYSTAYLADIALVQASDASHWRKWRWVLWLAGTLFALVFECYWIGDEIYPYVTAG